MRILVTGGTGFIGTPLVKKLCDEGHKLLLIVRRKQKSQRLGVSYLVTHLSNIKRYRDEITEWNPDIAIHMAWEGLPDYSYEMSLKNLKYGVQFINTIAQTNCKRILVTGSCFEYLNKNGILSEDSQLDYRTPFASAKNSLHDYANRVCKDRNINLIWTRLFFTYGPGQRKQALIPTCLRNIKDDKPTNVYTPQTKQDFIYIDDAIEALLCLIKNCNINSTYNIGSGYATSIKEITDMVYSINNKTNSVVYTEEGSNINYYADISKMKNEYNWSPKVNIRDGIRRIIKYEMPNM